MAHIGGNQDRIDDHLIPLIELKPAVALFHILEETSLQVGSGRPTGDRNQLWGSVVIVARAGLEGGLRRIHNAMAERGDVCSSSKFALDPRKFDEHLREHSREEVDSVPASLHVRLRTKPSARSGHGSGRERNGILSRKDLLESIEVLSHIRNGFAHYEPRKIEKLPRYFSGALWVESHEGDSWTVQKPHAFSVIRVCEAIYRYVVHSCFGLETAMRLRCPLLQLFPERCTDLRAVDTILGELVHCVKTDDKKRAIEVARELVTSLAAEDRQLDDGMLSLFPEIQWELLSESFLGM